MDSSGNALAVAAETPPLRRLSPVVLLSIYGIVPAILWFMLVDYAFTGLRLSRSLDVSSHNTFAIGLLLQAPHNFASLITFLDREYLKVYNHKLIMCAVVGIACLFIPWLVGQNLFVLFLFTYTFYHQSAQQAGIAAMLAQNKSRLHELWRWMSFTIFFVGLLSVAVSNMPVEQFPVQYKQILAVVAILYLAAYILVSASVVRRGKTRIGKAYIAANSLMFIAYSGFAFTGFTFFMLFIPVFVHDITAFAFYINHNQNRNSSRLYNFVSRVRHLVPMPEYLLTPLAGLLCGAVFFLGLNSPFYLYAATLLNVMHFYIEGIMWKSGALHRKYILV